MKLQQAIQETLSKVEEVQALDLGGGNPKEAWAQNEQLIKQLEEEISEIEQLSQIEDDLHFLQVCTTISIFSFISNICEVKQWSTTTDSLLLSLFFTVISTHCLVVMNGRTCGRFTLKRT